MSSTTPVQMVALWLWPMRWIWMIGRAIATG
jgi:hypothetical protein